MEDVLGTCLERGVKIVANAGGLNPAGLAAQLRELAGRLGLDARIAHITGDDLVARLPALAERGIDLANLDTGLPLAGAGLPVVTANAYLGGWGIAAALEAGADVVVCPRVTDASLACGPGRVVARLAPRRLGRAGRRRAGRPRHRVRAAGDRRQLQLP